MALVQWWNGFGFDFSCIDSGQLLNSPLPQSPYATKTPPAHHLQVKLSGPSKFDRGGRASPVAIVVRDRQVLKEENEKKMKTEKFAE